MNINYPKICIQKDNTIYIHFYLNGIRYRLSNGKRIGIDLAPNSFPIQLRYDKAKILAAEIYKYITSGGVFNEFRTKELISGTHTDIEYIELALKSKVSGNYSKQYKYELNYAYKRLKLKSKAKQITKSDIVAILDLYEDNSSYNSLLKNLKVLFNKANELGLKSNPTLRFKKRKIKASLNKPFKDVKIIIDEVTAFNDNLGLCCLITYGCLLRPHREVRELTWGDFSDDLKQINLSGARNKSGRNRIVPVPYYVQERLSKGEPHHNIFSGTEKPFNPDYFKSLWSRFKKVSKLLKQDQTLYSFRHSGAIEIYKRTGSLSKLQKAMGHSSLAVSLTYLRGLEVAELEENDMPMI